MSEMIKEFKKGDLLYIGVNKKAYWGLPQGYPYKEGEAHKITLPDDLSACENVSNYWYKVSDLTPAVSEVEEGQFVISNVDGDETYAIKGMIASSDENGFYLGEGHVIVAFVPNYSVVGMTFPNAGIYFYAHKGNVWVSEMAWSNETIHPMDFGFFPNATTTTPGTVKQMSYLPNATGDAPTAENFNQLVRELKNAGLMK